MQAYGPDYKSEVASRRTTVAFLQEAGMVDQSPCVIDPRAQTHDTRAYDFLIA